MDDVKKELLTYLERGDLLHAALVAGKVEDSDFNPEPYAERLVEAAKSLWRPSSTRLSDPVLIVQRINTIIFQKLGLVGQSETYKPVIDDATQYYLHNVLDKKGGCPLSFAVLYMCLAQQAGLQCECLAFPSAYYIKVLDNDGEFYVDPFANGKLISSSDFQRKFRAALQRNRLLSANLYEKVNSQQLVARIVQQLKHVYILKSHALQALRAVELLTALFPDSPELARDRGILYCEMEYFSKAIVDLRYYLAQRPNAEDVGEIKKLANMLRGYRETMN